MNRALPLAALAFGGLALLGTAARAEEEPYSRYELAVLEALRASEQCSLINSMLRRELRGQGLEDSRKVEIAVFALTRRGETRVHFARPERIALRDPACPEDPKAPLEQGAADLRGDVIHALEAKDCVMALDDPFFADLIKDRREDFSGAMGDLLADGDVTQIHAGRGGRIVYRTGEFCSELDPADTREEEIRRLDPSEPQNALLQLLLERAERGECEIDDKTFAAMAGHRNGVWGEEAEAAIVALAASGDAGRETAAGKSTVRLNIGALCQ